jgi:hypothetical protein
MAGQEPIDLEKAEEMARAGSYETARALAMVDIARSLRHLNATIDRIDQNVREGE